jgi:hypothetical protein
VWTEIVNLELMFAYNYSAIPWPQYGRGFNITNATYLKKKKKLVKTTYFIFIHFMLLTK